jgi:hypothetical protein
VQVRNKSASVSVSGAALRSTRTLEAHCREVEWHQDLETGPVPRASSRVVARSGPSASEAWARRPVKVSSSATVASSFGVTARACSFVQSQSGVSAAVARSFGGFVQARGALDILLPRLRSVPWPAALAQWLRLGCALTTRWSESAAMRLRRGNHDVEVLDQSASVNVSGAALRSTRTLEAHCREIEWHQDLETSPVP